MRCSAPYFDGEHYYRLSYRFVSGYMPLVSFSTGLVRIGSSLNPCKVEPAGLAMFLPDKQEHY